MTDEWRYWHLLRSSGAKFRECVKCDGRQQRHWHSAPSLGHTVRRHILTGFLWLRLLLRESHHFGAFRTHLRGSYFLGLLDRYDMRERHGLAKQAKYRSHEHQHG